MKTIKTMLLGAALAALAGNASAQSWLTNGLVAYYPFNGNASDASGSGNNGTVMNAQLTTNRFGQTSAAYTFDGVQSASGSRIIVTNNLLNLGQAGYTINIWFDSYIYYQGGVLFNTYFHNVGIGMSWSRFTAPSYAGALIGSGSSWDLRLDGNNYSPLAFGQLHSNTWYCATLTKTGTIYCYYINGRLQFTGTNSLAASYNFNDGFTLGSSGWNETLLGAIDDVRIYNRGLSASEVAELYAVESGPRVDLIKAVKPSFSYLWVGTNYQMQLSADMNTWTNHGSPFTATNTSMVYPQYWDVDGWGSLFFRLRQVP
jgi:hypothetical protein